MKRERDREEKRQRKTEAERNRNRSTDRYIFRQRNSFHLSWPAAGRVSPARNYLCGSAKRTDVPTSHGSHIRWKVRIDAHEWSNVVNVIC